MKKSSGLFVTFEGTEGAGKSTLIRAVASRLEQLGQTSQASQARKKRTIQLTREPGGSPIAERIRNVILEEHVDPWAELFLYEAARAEHMARKIVPALSRGEIVLCDRFTDSALAYQAHARGLPWKKVAMLNDLATGGIHPDMTVLLDIDPEVGLRRANDQNRFEAEGLEFQKKVRRGFLKSRAEEPKRWFTLKMDDRTPEQLAEDVVAEMLRRFGKPRRQRRVLL